jgi:prevent-host-death family protein
MDEKSIGAGEFKQGCLALLDEVAEHHLQIVITKRGKPVAKLVPIESDESREQAVLKRLRGRGRMLVRSDKLLEPSSTLSPWSTVEDD